MKYSLFSLSQMLNIFTSLYFKGNVKDNEARNQNKLYERTTFFRQLFKKSLKALL